MWHRVCFTVYDKTCKAENFRGSEILFAVSVQSTKQEIFSGKTFMVKVALKQLVDAIQLRMLLTL